MDSKYLTKEEVIQVVNALLVGAFDNLEKYTSIIDLTTEEALQKVENYLNRKVPKQLKFVVARMVQTSILTTYANESNLQSGESIKRIKEDTKEVEFDTASESPNLNILSFNTDILKELHRYRVMSR
jgi:hypothetical protein|nr:MAG TPA: tail connector protein [Caudoviricetes sp.]